jgi:hypothetical protein
MDEMTLLREFRDSAPAATPTEVRERALGVPRPTRRPFLRLAVAAALAVTGGGVAVTALDPGAPSAATVLGHAAQALLEADPGPTPRPDQWVYTLSSNVQRFAGDPDPGREPIKWPYWTRMDGDGYAEISPETHQLNVQECECTWPHGDPEQWYAVAVALPEDPAAVLQTLRDDPLYVSDGTSQADRDFDEVTSMLTMQTYLPPASIARLYQALAIIPGVGIDDQAAPDLAGRPVLSVTYSGDLSLGRKGDHWELLLDPDSFEVTGLRGTAGEDWAVEKGTERVEKGTVWYEWVVYDQRLVDHAGDTD